MAYKLKENETVTRALRRIAEEQIDKALNELDDDALDTDETIHQLRKRCKKIRGLLRLVRPALGKIYKHENKALRNAARRLAPARDTKSMLESVEKLKTRFESDIDSSIFKPVSIYLSEVRERALREFDVTTHLTTFREDLESAKARTGDWDLSENGFDAIRGGVKKTYSRAYTGMAKAIQAPNAKTLHEWRKRVKYHWYHMRLLRQLDSVIMNARIERLDELSDILGDEHDLALLRDTALTEMTGRGHAVDLNGVLELLDLRRKELQALAHPLGAKLLSEKPAHFIRRMEHFWKAWQTETALEGTLPDAAFRAA